MRFACRNARVLRVGSRALQDRGDGRLFAFEPRLDETLVVPRLILGLQHGLYLANREPGAFGRLRLRASMVRGAVAVDGPTGFLGRAPISVTRMLDSRQLRGGLSGSPAADLAFMAGDELYQDVLLQDYPELPSSAFTREDVQYKEFKGTGWMYVPDPGPVLSGAETEKVWKHIRYAATALGAGAGAFALYEAMKDDDVLDPDLLADVVFTGDWSDAESTGAAGEPDAESADYGAYDLAQPAVDDLDLDVVDPGGLGGLDDIGGFDDLGDPTGLGDAAWDGLL